MNSVYECIKGFTEAQYSRALTILGIKELPKVGQAYDAKDIIPCDCGNPEHFIIELEQYPGIGWPLSHFREVFNVDNVIAEALKNKECITSQ